MARYEEQLLATKPVVQSYGKSGDMRSLRIDIGSVTLWYSYTTVIAFKVAGQPVVVHENDWTRTTGKHLNLIDKDKKIRVGEREFNARWHAEVWPVLLAAKVAAITFVESDAYKAGRRRIDSGLLQKE